MLVRFGLVWATLPGKRVKPTLWAGVLLVLTGLRLVICDLD